MRLGRLLLCATTSGVLLAGCGTDEQIGEEDRSAPGRLSPAAAPEPRESISAAQERIAALAASADCDSVLEAFPLARQARAEWNPVSCEAFQALGDTEVVGVAAFSGGAEVDYETHDGRRLSAGLILDADGLYHLLALRETDRAPAGRPGRGGDAAARGVVEALREKDCGRFEELAVGPWGGPGVESDPCGYVARNPLGELLGTYPRAQPTPLGAGAHYAFYGLRGPDAHYTMVMARDPGADGEDQQYRYLDAVPTGVGVPLPRSKESIMAALERVGVTAASQDCTRVYELNPLSLRPTADIPEQCEVLRGLAELEVAEAAPYRGGAVIDYEGNAVRPSGVFILDADGRYHLALIDRYRTRPSVGTPFAPEFDRAVEATVEALRDRDCDAFREVALDWYGPGAGDPCIYAEHSPLTKLLELYPQARPVRLGGNGSYAFYAIGSPETSYTLVMARQSQADAPAGAPPLPEGAAEYGFLDAYLTHAGGMPVEPPS